MVLVSPRASSLIDPCKSTPHTPIINVLPRNASSQRQTRPKQSTGLSSRTQPKMSRAGSSAARNLTLTEELERLEQSITLTLQGRLYLHLARVTWEGTNKAQKSTQISAGHTA